MHLPGAILSPLRDYNARMKPVRTATVAQIDDFEEVIDVRTPPEFEEDCIPGAVNRPVLSTEERARVGTTYKQVAPFEGLKLGATLISRNIATHIETSFADRPRNWTPLIYCWRGGKRSGAMAHILREVGWVTTTLEGGYKAYRREVVAQMATLPDKFRYRVVCGSTGSGKSRLLEALDELGAQVLDLEAIAKHRGSVLGDLPDDPQPAQKMFESRVWNRLRKFDPRRAVFVEAESKKIGRLYVPEVLLTKIRSSECLVVDAPVSERVGFLIAEYEHFLTNPEHLKRQIGFLSGLYPNETIARWRAQIDASEWPALVEDLLVNHYDPAYTRSTTRNFGDLAAARVLQPASLSPRDIAAVAREIVTQGAAGSD